jgi:hypothetical protein
MTAPELRSTAADMEGSGDVPPTPQSPLSLFGTDPLLGEALAYWMLTLATGQLSKARSRRPQPSPVATAP